MVWLSREHLLKEKRKKQMQRHWKQGQVTWEGYRKEVQFLTEVRKAKTTLLLNLASDSKNNKRSSTDMLTRKGKSKKCTH